MEDNRFGLFVLGMTSKLEKHIRSLVRVQFPDYQMECNIRPEWLTTEAGDRLELDIYLPELEMAFEIQGEQHCKHSPYFHRKDGDFERQLERDRRKRLLCEKNEITLIEIASAGDYEASQSNIVLTVKRAEKKRLHKYILQRAAQTVINIIGLYNKVERRTELLQKSRSLGHKPDRHLEKGLLRDIEQLEEHRELLRYISIRAIQDFYGLVPFKRPLQRQRKLELLAMGKTPTRPRFDRKRFKGRVATVRRWV